MDLPSPSASPEGVNHSPGSLDWLKPETGTVSPDVIGPSLQMPLQNATEDTVQHTPGALDWLKPESSDSGTVSPDVIGPSLQMPLENATATQDEVDPSSSLTWLEICGVSAGQRRSQIEEILSFMFGYDLAAIDTTRASALKWLLRQDPMRLCPDSANLIQRYILALLYYGTAGNEWYECESTESACFGSALLAGSHECELSGIECDGDGRVIKIKLDGRNLQGSIPEEIGKLAYLKEIDLDDNELYGPLPASIGTLSRLEFLSIDKNMLSGSIPEALYDASSLRAIDLDSNLLTGTLSTRIGELTNLYFLQLDFNGMTGDLPPELETLSKLRYLSLFKTSFASLPEGLCIKEVDIYADCALCEIADCCKACLMSES